MKVLVISAGLGPLRGGGLIAYVEEMIGGLRSLGHEIVYLNMNGRSALPFTYVKDEIVDHKKYTIYNSGLYVDGERGTLEPLRQVYPSRRVRRIVDRILREEQPDIIHIHELLGFPVALLEHLKQKNQKVIFTAHDYYALCPTIKLFKKDLKNCSLGNAELTCKECCANANFSWEVRAHDVIDRIQKRVVRGTRLWRLMRKEIQSVSSILNRYFVRPHGYVARRLEFLKYLKFPDAVVAVSALQLSNMKAVLGEQSNLRYMYLARQTFGSHPVKSAPQTPANKKVVFVALNVHMPAKGSKLLENVFSNLASRYQNFELRMYGASGNSTSAIKYMGVEYRPTDLDDIVRSADFGIVPSLWHETYGYVGPEMLSRGLPLIVSSTGAMVEYVEDGKNGLVFDPSDENNLTILIEKILNDPSFRMQIAASTLQSCDRFMQFSDHLRDVENLYLEIRNAA